MAMEGELLWQVGRDGRRGKHHSQRSAGEKRQENSGKSCWPGCGRFLCLCCCHLVTGKNKGPTLDWLASLLEPLVKAAGRSLSSNSAWYKATRIASQTIRRAAHGILHRAYDSHSLQQRHPSWRTSTNSALKNNGVFVPADLNTPVLHLNEFAVPEVRVQPPPSSDEGSSPVRELHQMQRLNEAASRSEVAAAMQSEARSRPAH
ncbi:hypothetical protein C8R43DRAFT_592056 [Mycena crocata]|nr:hypothetical protein C8R43DRAFT_592056 [Mycena crocata]